MNFNICSSYLLSSLLLVDGFYFSFFSASANKTGLTIPDNNFSNSEFKSPTVRSWEVFQKGEKGFYGRFLEPIANYTLKFL
jgi:hypothetical protein